MTGALQHRFGAAHPPYGPAYQVGARTLARRASSVVLAGHGLIHLMGVALLWHLGQPGALRYADAHPDPGSPAAGIVGAVWLMSGLLFGLAALRLRARRPAWRRAALPAVVLSIPVLAMSVSVAAAGLAVDGLVVLALALTTASPGAPK